MLRCFSFLAMQSAINICCLSKDHLRTKGSANSYPAFASCLFLKTDRLFELYIHLLFFVPYFLSVIALAVFEYAESPAAL